MKTEIMKWLVVSLSVNELGIWKADSRKQALSHKRTLLTEGCEMEDVYIYRGKIIESRLTAGVTQKT